MGYKLKKLAPRHHKIIELLLMGKSQRRIARRMELSDYGLSCMVNSPIFQAELARRREQQNARLDEAEVVRRLSAREILDDATVRAAEAQVSNLESSNARVAQKAAMDILDRGGCPKVSRSQGQQVQANLVLSEKGLERMQKAALEVFGRGLKGLPDLGED